SRLLERVPKQSLLSLFSACFHPPLPGLLIDTRFVMRVLGLERAVCGPSQIWMGFGAQDLLQCRDSASVWWVGSQSTDGFLSHPPIGIVLRHLDEQTHQITRKTLYVKPFWDQFEEQEKKQRREGSAMISTRHQGVYHAAQQCQAASLSLTPLRLR